MKILILFAADLFPIKGMYQVRVFNQIKYLSDFHKIDFANLATDLSSIEETKVKIAPYVTQYYPLRASIRPRSRLTRGMTKLIRICKYHLSQKSREEISLNTNAINMDVNAIIENKDYDAIIIHYWYWGFFFKEVKAEVMKILDTHYVVEENLELFDQGYYKTRNRARLRKELLHSREKQYEYFEQCDLVVVNSEKQARIIKGNTGEINVIVAENGQDLEEYMNYQREPDNSKVLFYGALSSQFNKLALERILRGIFPKIRAKVPDSKLMIVGSNPPMDLIGRFNSQDIEVTGFVEDIKPVISQCALMLLPLESGSGFRGRAIEVMALGVPIVGTQNGLQSVGIENGIHGYIAESDAEIVSKSVLLMKDEALRTRISKNAREFAAKNFSLEATFGKLNQYLLEAQARPRVRNDEPNNR
jgi:polysaccharide biosynthesis protein PslH